MNMKRTEFKTILLGIVLAGCGAVLYFIGERTVPQKLPDENILFSNGLVDGWTLWHYAGSILIFFAIPLIIGAVMAWIRRHNAKNNSQSILSGLS